MEFLDCIVVLVLSVLRNFRLLFPRGCTRAHSPSSVEVPFPPHPLQHLSLVCLITDTAAH